MSRAEHRAWLLGFGAAVAALVRLHDEPTLAADVLLGDGITVDSIRRAGAEEFDMEQLRKVAKEGRYQNARASEREARRRRRKP